MRAYKLSHGGASGLGLSPIQVIQNGRVRSVSISATLAVDAAIAVDYGLVQVGTQAVSESGVATGAPVNFAFAGVSPEASNVATDKLGSVNVTIPCDFPVLAGQELVLNIAGAGTAGANWEQVEVLVWVQ